MGLGEREVELGGPVLVEQAKETRGGAAEMSAVEGDFPEERLRARAGGHQSVSPAMLARVALLVGEAVEVARVFDLPTSLPAARVDGDLVVAVEHAHGAGRTRRA